MKPAIRILFFILWITSLFYFSSITSENGKILGFIICVILGTIVQLEDSHIVQLKNFFRIK